MAAIYVGGIFRSRESLLSRGFFFCVSSSDVVLCHSLRGGAAEKPVGRDALLLSRGLVIFHSPSRSWVENSFFTRLFSGKMFGIVEKYLPLYLKNRI